MGREAPRVCYYLGKLIGDVLEGDDLLQDVWLDGFKSLPKSAVTAAFPAWLYRLARDHAFRRLRRHRPPRNPAPEDELADRPDRDDEFTADDAAGVPAALDQLLPEHREVLVLRFLEGMAYKDVARVVGCPLGTVKLRMYHAKRGLRRVIEEPRVEP